MKRAVRAHIIEKLSLKTVSEDYNINIRTLARYCKKIKTEILQTEPGGIPTEVHVGYKKNRQV